MGTQISAIEALVPPDIAFVSVFNAQTFVVTAGCFPSLNFGRQEPVAHCPE